MSSSLAAVCFNALAAILLAAIVWVVGRKAARRGGWLAKREQLCHAGMLATIFFVAFSLRLLPCWFESEPLQTVEQLGRLAFALGTGLAVHGLLLRMLVRS